MRKSSGLENAPSTTGKPSGKNRGNAPIRPNRTPPPAPKTNK
ncbi:hypothetical protein [Oceanihabitans sediminis]|nr:hypothetical protein [Oceanihabitans sediminis]MDX1774024.1 hypothetical protein [Oceanihabitans sediminis]